LRLKHPLFQLYRARLRRAEPWPRGSVRLGPPISRSAPFNAESLCEGAPRGTPGRPSAALLHSSGYPFHESRQISTKGPPRHVRCGYPGENHADWNPNDLFFRMPRSGVRAPAGRRCPASG
jgi:hypothetical protein